MTSLKPLGNSGLKTSPLAFGGNVFGWTADRKTTYALLDALVDAGINFIDTADVYSLWNKTPYISETLIGEWLKQSGKRSRVLVATKVGMEITRGVKGLKRDYILSSVDNSLKRLQTDVIDLYQSHADDPETPLEETLATYGELIKSGKVRAIGASNYKGARLADAMEVSERRGLPRYATLQPLYNLYDREGFEKDLLPVCNKYGIAVIPYFSLAAGFLTGKYRSEADLAKSTRGPRTVKNYLTPRGFSLLAVIDEIARETGATPAQVSLAWLRSRPTVAAPIVSATSIDQLKDILKSVSLKLSPEQIARLDAV